MREIVYAIKSFIVWSGRVYCSAMTLVVARESRRKTLA